MLFAVMKEASEGPFAKGEEKNTPKASEKYVVTWISMHATPLRYIFTVMDKLLGYIGSMLVFIHFD